MILKNGKNLLEEIQEFIRNSERLIIITPYIKNDSLVELLRYCRGPVEIIVRWQFQDLVTGASDLKIFATCQANGIRLYRNPRIHLKCYINNFRDCIITTANISKRALSNNDETEFNHEVGTKVNNLSFGDNIYFQSILNESTLVTSQMLDRIRAVLDVSEVSNEFNSDFDWHQFRPDKDFLLSALPMSYSVETLKEIYFKKKTSNITDYNCAIHDLVLYKIEGELSEKQFSKVLKANFFSHPFIQAFLAEVDKQYGGAHFGFVRRWIANNCANVPLPRAWEVTKNVQILFRWIVKLSHGKYEVQIPGRRSERLRMIGN